MPRIQRSRDDLKAALVDNVSLMQIACKAFDTGTSSAAKYLAVSLRILLHQTDNGRSRALLDQLGLRQGRFYDCAFPLDAPGKTVHYMQSCRLAAVFVGKGTGQTDYLPCLEQTDVRKPFAEWWNEIVIVDGKRNTFSRQELISNVADTDGGAHVDAALDEKYNDFSRRNSLNQFLFSGHGPWRAAADPHLAAVRTVAHEVLRTLGQSARWAFKEPYTFADPMEGREGLTIGPIALEIKE